MKKTFVFIALSILLTSCMSDKDLTKLPIPDAQKKEIVNTLEPKETVAAMLDAYYSCESEKGISYYDLSYIRTLFGLSGEIAQELGKTEDAAQLRQSGKLASAAMDAELKQSVDAMSEKCKKGELFPKWEEQYKVSDVSVSGATATVHATNGAGKETVYILEKIDRGWFIFDEKAVGAEAIETSGSESGTDTVSSDTSVDTAPEDTESESVENISSETIVDGE